ncbi:MAG TPA: dihydroorotate dehydrogenase [Acidimicrobiales bacterium]|jgi:dihydroorotate dehydrogenase (NAD+) catalytic subunit|nr:dihydroorotate dehydrogenase [Acidimicrobiales bacterium]
MSLVTQVGSVALRSPIMTASGTAGHGAELAGHMDLSMLGAVVVKSVSAEAWAGNPPPRLHPLPAAMINSVGLQNGGVHHWLTAELPDLAATGAAIVASIWGFTADAYRAVAESVADAVRGGAAPGVVAVEANISCPNVEDRRLMFAHSVEGVTTAVGAAAQGLDGALPLWAKLSPNVTDLPSLAGAAVASGAEAVTLINTVMGMAIDPATGRFRLGGGGGGLSGPAIHPVAVRAVYETRAAWPDLPIVGVGGVASGEDAAELIAAGADAVQVGTATFADPTAPARVNSELATWMAAHDVTSIAALKGRAHEHR